MRKKQKKVLSGCPIDFGLDVFGDRWTLLVVRDLMFAGKRHFNELMQSPERIASNILAARLKKLEERGLIERSSDPESRKQVIYKLTEKGRDLIPVMVALIRWGGRYDPNTPVPASFVERHAADNDALLNDVRAAMMEAARTMAQKKDR